MTSNDELELKPCPFCGAKDATLFIRPGDGWRYMQCISCMGQSGSRPTIESAISAWNQRSKQEQSDGDTEGRPTPP